MEGLHRRARFVPLLSCYLAASLGAAGCSLLADHQGSSNRNNVPRPGENGLSGRYMVKFRDPGFGNTSLLGPASHTFLRDPKNLELSARMRAIVPRLFT